ncbi:MAG: O-antigen ligase family protein [Limnobacter sp.]|uniref:O-antigen ligase family protein n=1 Tax=Limnobacter sp. TaxID=2003368 RepID=UPI003918ABEA
MSLSQFKNPALYLALSAFFLPIKPAPVNLFLVAALITLLLQSEVLQRLKYALLHPISLSAFALLAYLLLTIAWPESTWEEAQGYISKYARFALLPFIALMASRDEDRIAVFDAFSLGVAVSVAASIALQLGWLPGEGSTYFKMYLTHNFFIVMAAAYAVWRIERSWGLWPVGVRVSFLALCAVCFYNFLFMVEGRSGWVAMACIPLVLAARRTGFKGVLGTVLVLAALSWALYEWVPFVHARIGSAILEAQQFMNGQAVSVDTSNGRRLNFWMCSLEAIQAAPWFGHGMGGFGPAIEPCAQRVGLWVFDNPHNQYLLFAVQGGLMALLLYAVFAFNVARAGSPHKTTLLCILVAYLVLNGLNSFHYDFAEGVFFLYAIGLMAFADLNKESKT